MAALPTFVVAVVVTVAGQATSYPPHGKNHGFDLNEFFLFLLHGFFAAVVPAN